MKKLYYILITLFSISVSGQTDPYVLPQGATSQVSKFRGGAVVDSILQLPVRNNTSIYPGISMKGRIQINKQNNNLYYHNGTTWVRVGEAKTHNQLDGLQGGNGINEFIHLNVTQRDSLNFMSSQFANKAPLSSPAFTDLPTAPTAAPGTNTAQLATTAFAQTAASSVIAQTITDGLITSAPSQDAVFDALAVKNNKTFNTITVAKSGGDYDSVQAAIDASDDYDTILIYPGVYEESLNTIGKNISLVGFDKYITVIKSATGDYYSPPLNCSGGTKAYNLTFLATSEEAESPTLFSYAVHMDYAGEGVTEFNNCIIESHQNSAMGIGLHQDQTLIVDNCQLLKYSDGAVYNNGALYMHNSPTAESNQKMIVRNSFIWADQGLHTRIDDSRHLAGGVDINTTVTFQFNQFWSETHGDGVGSYWMHEAPIDGGISGKIQLTGDSGFNSTGIFNKKGEVTDEMTDQVIYGQKNFQQIIKTRGLFFNKHYDDAGEWQMYNDYVTEGDFKLHNSLLGFIYTINPDGTFTHHKHLMLENQQRVFFGQSGFEASIHYSGSTGNLEFNPRSGYGFDFKGGAEFTENIKIPLTPTETTHAASKGYVDATRPYKVYTALITQSGTSAPSAVVLENTIGAIVWSRNSQGTYHATLTGAFTSNKTFATITFGNVVGAAEPRTCSALASGSDIVRFDTYQSGSAADSLLQSASVEIRVYN